MAPLDLRVLLRRLSEATGPSGYEDRVRALVQDVVTPLSDDCRVDALGNLIAFRKGEHSPGSNKSPGSIILTAHMDEISLMVAGIEGEYLRFVMNGGHDARTLPGQEVLIHASRAGQAASYPGLIAVRPRGWSHIAQPDKVAELTDLVLDLGLPAGQVGGLFQVGDSITLRAPMLELGEKKVAGKAFDDRICLTAVIGALDQLSRQRHSWDVYLVATTQEEVGLRGATVAGFGVEADLAVVLDVAFAPQPGLDSNVTVEMGKGPVLAHGPNFHPLLTKRIQDTARNLDIPLLEEVLPGPSGTDAWAIQVARSGIPTALLEISIASMHSPNEVADWRDLERTARLLAGLVAGLDNKTQAELQYRMPV